MKNAGLLIALCVLFSFTAAGQSTAPVEKNTNRITITTKKVDDNGKAITETWIAEGNEPSKILQEMAIHPEVMQKVEIETATNPAQGERLFLFRSAGDQLAVEGTLNESTEISADIIIITETDEISHPMEYKKNCTPNGYKPRASATVTVGDRKSNCAALGVWAYGTSGSDGARINGLIEKGGAQEAGLHEGDIIRKIDEFDVNDFSTLNLALSHFRPGDEVTVRYVREDKNRNVRVTLKDWADLPGHEWRSREDCGKDESRDQENSGFTPEDEPVSTSKIKPLDLQDVTVYPNPTEGVFSFSFTTYPGPITVSITDINGKVVFRDGNKNTSGSYHKDIDLKELPQGNYVICVRQDDKIYTQQISKQ